MNRRVFNVFFLICLCFFGFSCSFEFDKYGNVGVLLPGRDASRTVESLNPLPSGSGLPSSYSIKILSAKGVVTERTGNAGDKVVIKKIVPGSYEIVVEGKTEVKLFHGKTNVVVQAGKTARAEIRLAVSDITPDIPGGGNEPEVPGSNIMSVDEAVTAIGKATGEESFNVKLASENDFTKLKNAIISNSNLNALIRLDISTSSSITKVPDNGFTSCEKLVQITLPDTVTSIGASAFEGCSNLENIVIPGEVTTLGANSFKNCAWFTEIVIPGKVELIDSGAFAGCSGLTKITFASSIPWNITGQGTTFIPGTADSNAKALTSTYKNDKLQRKAETITLAKAKEIVPTKTSGNFALVINDISNSNIGELQTLIKSVNKNATVELDLSESASLTVSGTFSDCGSLKAVVYPKNIEKVEQNAFKNCTKLESVNLGTKVSTIESNAFSGCSSLKNINIPQSVKIIKAGAFTGVTLISATMGSGVNWMLGKSGVADTYYVSGTAEDNGAKINSSGTLNWIKIATPKITTFYVDNTGNDEVGSGEETNPVKSVSRVIEKIGSSNEAINIKVKNDISEGKVISISSNSNIVIEGIGVSKPSIKAVNSDLQTPGIANHGVMEINNSSANVTLKNIIITNGKATNGGGIKLVNGILKLDAGTEIKANDGTGSGKGIYVAKTGTSSLIFAGNILFGTNDDIYLEKADSCINLETGFSTSSQIKITLDSSRYSTENVVLTGEITGKNTNFKLNNEKYEINASGKVTEKILTVAEAAPLIRAATGEQTFKVNLASENDFTTLSDAVKNTSALINLDISTSAGTAIPGSAFFNCDKLKSITLNSNITTIGNQAFQGCKALTGVTLPTKLQSLGTDVFKLSGIETIEIPEGIAEIPTGTFDQCSKLTSVTIPDTVETIGANAFKGCDKLSNATMEQERVWYLSAVGASKPATTYKTNGSGDGASLYDSSYVDRTWKKYPAVSDIINTSNNTFKITLPTSGVMGILVNSNAEVETLGQVLPELTTPPAYDVDLKFTSNVTDFGKANLYGRNIAKVSIPSSITKIPNETFQSCTRLKNIVIPATVTEIGYHAFYNSGLDTVIFEANNSVWDFYDSYGNSATGESYDVTGKASAALATALTKESSDGGASEHYWKKR